MKKNKIVLAILFVLILCSCSKKSEDFSRIKNGRLNSCTEYTIDELVSGYLENPVWKKEKSDLGYEVYNVSGSLYNKIKDKESVVIIQFALDSNDIILKRFELDKVQQNSSTYSSLINDMCKYAKNELSIAKNNTTYNYALLKNDFFEESIIEGTRLIPKALVDYYIYDIDYELSYEQYGDFEYQYKLELENLSTNDKQIIYTNKESVNNSNTFNIKYNYKLKSFNNSDNYKINLYLKIDSKNDKFKKDEYLFSSLFIDNSSDVTKLTYITND